MKSWSGRVVCGTTETPKNESGIYGVVVPGTVNPWSTTELLLVVIVTRTLFWAEPTGQVTDPGKNELVWTLGVIYDVANGVDNIGVIYNWINIIKF